MILNNIKSKQSSRGFTIVELLVVIVVIGILASITIVSYTGVTSRANTASAQSAANAVISKAIAYNTDSTAATFPITLATLTGAASTTSYFLSGVTYGALAAKPASPSVVQFNLCGTTGTTTAPTQYSEISSNPTGVKIGYWDYSTSAVVYYTAGTVSGNAGPTSTYPVGCYVSGS